MTYLVRLWNLRPTESKEFTEYYKGQYNFVAIAEMTEKKKVKLSSAPRYNNLYLLKTYINSDSFKLRI